MKDLNRLKIVLVEHKKTRKWLSELLRKDTSTVSKMNKVEEGDEILILNEQLK